MVLHAVVIQMLHHQLEVELFINFVFILENGRAHNFVVLLLMLKLKFCLFQPRPPSFGDQTLGMALRVLTSYRQKLRLASRKGIWTNEGIL